MAPCPLSFQLQRGIWWMGQGLNSGSLLQDSFLQKIQIHFSGLKFGRKYSCLPQLQAPWIPLGAETPNLIEIKFLTSCQWNQSINFYFPLPLIELYLRTIWRLTSTLNITSLLTWIFIWFSVHGICRTFSFGRWRVPNNRYTYPISVDRRS